jgi:hypothetical protein
MNVTIAILSDHPCEAWWTAARATKAAPRELAPLLRGKADSIEVPKERAHELRLWCSTIDGWDPEHPPLTFGIRGRVPSQRGTVGGLRVSVRLAPDELAVLERLASAREQSVADLLRTSALVEAMREEARPEVEDDDRAEAVAAEAIEVGDLVYTDVAHVPPRGRPERVMAVERIRELWRLDLASGAPLWLAAGTEVWRRPRSRASGRAHQDK